MVLFTYHKFGAYVRFVGDNSQSAQEMGINVRLVKAISFVYVGLASGFVGVLAILINNYFYPTVGDAYLLTVLAAIFVGGTPHRRGLKPNRKKGRKKDKHRSDVRKSRKTNLRRSQEERCQDRSMRPKPCPNCKR